MPALVMNTGTRTTRMHMETTGTEVMGTAMGVMVTLTAMGTHTAEEEEA